VDQRLWARITRRLLETVCRSQTWSTPASSPQATSTMPDTDPPKENPLPRKQDKSHAHRKQSSPDNAPPAKRGRSKKSQRKPGRKAKAWVKATSEHPFATVASDHAETPRDAYVDILPLLHACSRACQKKPENLKVWDPYVIAGSVVISVTAAVASTHVVLSCLVMVGPRGEQILLRGQSRSFDERSWVPECHQPQRRLLQDSSPEA